MILGRFESGSLIDSFAIDRTKTENASCTRRTKAIIRKRQREQTNKHKMLMIENHLRIGMRQLKSSMKGQNGNTGSPGALCFVALAATDFEASAKPSKSRENRSVFAAHENVLHLQKNQ